MFVSRATVCAFLGLLLLSIAPPAIVYADSPEQGVPPGFYPVSSGVGVQLYRKDYPGGNPDFVQVINLSQGASIELLHGEISEARVAMGVYGGNDPRMIPQKLSQYWDKISVENQAAFCVTNGEFFFMIEYPPRLPFPLKVDGEIVSDGFGEGQYPGQKLMLEIWKDKVYIIELTRESLLSSTAPDIVAGLTEDARKSPTKYVGRTFVGVDDKDRDGRFETVLFLNTRSARQIDAAGVLRDFGADKVMMLDGGGSTQLICHGKSYVSSERPIPQAIAIIEGDKVEQTTLGIISSDQTLIDIGVREELNIGDTLWIPLMMSPIFLVLFIFIRNTRLDP